MNDDDDDEWMNIFSIVGVSWRHCFVINGVWLQETWWNLVYMQITLRHSHYLVPNANGYDEQVLLLKNLRKRSLTQKKKVVSETSLFDVHKAMSIGSKLYE